MKHLYSLKVQSVESLQQVSTAVKFFLKNVGEEYISHGEVSCGRASIDFKWDRKLKKVLESEFKENTFLVLINSKIVGLFVIRRVRNTAHLEDFVIDAGFRGKGLSDLVMDAIHDKLLSEGCEIVFLETGSRNKRAKRFFERAGYKKCSAIMFSRLK